MSAPYIPFYTSDFLGGTGGMTAAQKGVYITLLCLIYEEEGPVPQSWDMLARRCGCTLPAFKKAVEALQQDGKIEVINGAIWSPKCAKHITQRGERRNSARSAAEKRWQKTEQKQGKPDANAMRGQCQPEPEPEYTEDTSVSSDADGVDFAKAIWENGVAFLAKHDVPIKQARSIIGRWRKSHDDRDIFDAFSAASRAGVVDPVPWITARLTGKGKANEQSAADDAQRIADEWFSEQGTRGVDSGRGENPPIPLFPAIRG